MNPRNLDTSHLAEKDFGFFFRAVLRQKMSGMHEAIIDAAMNDPRDLVIMAHRGSGKTNLLSRAFPLWICYRTPKDDPQIIVIQSASLEQSTEILRGIKRLVTTNTALRTRLMPENIHETKWSETQLEFKNGHRIICRPFGDTIRGLHVNYSLCDDVLKDESTNVEEAKKTFYSVVYPITQAKKGKHIVVGTPMSFADLLYDLEKRESFRSLKFPAFKPDGSPQFPEMFPLEKLQRIRETMPRHLWSREYLIVPVSEESALFPYESLIRPAVEMAPPQFTEDEERSAVYVVGGDVAVSEKDRGDFSCYTEIKVVPGHPWVLHKKHYFKGMGTGQQGEFVATLHKERQFAKVLVEQTGLSYGVVDFLLRDDRTKFVTEGFNTTQKSKWEILGLLETTLRNGGLKLPKDDSLIDELAGWEIITKDGKQVPRSTKEHDDQVMSLAIACFAASQFTGNAGVVGVTRKGESIEHKPLNTMKEVDVLGVRRNEDVFSPVGDNYWRPSAEERTWVG